MALSNPRYPDRIRVGSERSGVYERRPDLYSLRSDSSDQPKGAVAVIEADASTAFLIFQGEPNQRVAKRAGPVYSAGPDGPLAVPSGRVFVRLAEGMKPQQRSKEFSDAGFEIERTLPYAPNAAWLRPKGGDLAESLAGLAAVEKTPGVEHVEPQMILHRAARSD